MSVVYDPPASSGYGLSMSGVTQTRIDQKTLWLTHNELREIDVIRIEDGIELGWNNR